MAELGGYLAVSYVSKNVFTDALEALWRTEWQRASGTAQWAADIAAFGRMEATGGISLDKPGMVFRGAANAIEVRLTGAMRAELTLNDTDMGGVFIAFDVVVFLRVNVTQEGAFKKAVVDLSGFTLDAAQLRLTWFDGPHSANAEPALLSVEAREAFANEVRKRAARYLTFRLPTDQVFMLEMTMMTQGIPGSILVTPIIQLGNVRILDDWFALGIDATSTIGETHGNAATIGPPPDAPPLGAAPMPQADPGPGTLRLFVDPALATKYLLANAKLAVLMASASRPNLHPNLDGIQVFLEDDTIVLNAGGNVDAPDPFPGQMPFTANVRIRPFIPKNTRTVYASIKPDVRVDAPWYMEVLGAIVDLFGGDAFGKLRRANKSEMAILFGVAVRQTNVPETFGVYASLEGRQLVIRPNLFGIYGEAAVTTTFSEPDLSPAPKVESAVPIRDRFLQLRFASSRLSVDPTFRVRYRIKRGSSGVEVASGTAWSGTNEPFGATVDLWDPANVRENSYTVELTVERPPGTQVGHVVQTVKVLDPFDRSHPFVRWRKKHYFTGALQPLMILSAIHRTAIPGRCKFCDFRNSRFGTPYVYQALDTLPAPEQEGFSTRLCKYCFPDA